MKIKIERIQKEKMSKRKRADFSGQASKNGACPLAFTVM